MEQEIIKEITDTDRLNWLENDVNGHQGIDILIDYFG
jgi:hypothetical protein